MNRLTEEHPLVCFLALGFGGLGLLVGALAVGALWASALLAALGAPAVVIGVTGLLLLR